MSSSDNVICAVIIIVLFMIAIGLYFPNGEAVVEACSEVRGMHLCVKGSYEEVDAVFRKVM